jgi:hypothetical protein
MLFKPQFGDALPWNSGPTAVSARQKLLLERPVFEDVKHAQCRGYRLDAELFFEVLLQLALPVELLERADPGEHAIAELDLRFSAAGNLDLGRDYQQLLR